MRFQSTLHISLCLQWHWGKCAIMDTGEKVIGLSSSFFCSCSYFQEFEFCEKTLIVMTLPALTLLCTEPIIGLQQCGSGANSMRCGYKHPLTSLVLHRQRASPVWFSRMCAEEWRRGDNYPLMSLIKWIPVTVAAARMWCLRKWG